MTRFLLSFPILLPLLCGAPVRAETLWHFTASTNYLWRGVTQTDDNAAISAAIEHHAQQGGYLGLWTSNTNYGDRPSYEVDIYLGHQFDLAQASIDLSARHYYFPSGGKYSYDFQADKWANHESSSFTELQLGVIRAKWNAGYSYSNNYLDSGKPGYYIELNYTHPVTDKLSLKLHYGSQRSEAIDDTPEHRVSDRSVTLEWRNIFFTASNLSDNIDGRQTDKVRYVFGWSMAVGL